ncbi:MAG TPA: hypothetical protein VFW87_14815 [Pirellulales bacterium]|nr:hypothetical protein [Pirellulales bacterium]
MSIIGGPRNLGHDLDDLYQGALGCLLVDRLYHGRGLDEVGPGDVLLVVRDGIALSTFQTDNLFASRLLATRDFTPT